MKIKALVKKANDHDMWLVVSYRMGGNKTLSRHRTEDEAKKAAATINEENA